MLACTRVMIALRLPKGSVPPTRIPEFFVMSAASRVSDEAIRTHAVFSNSGMSLNSVGLVGESSDGFGSTVDGLEEP